MYCSSLITRSQFTYNDVTVHAPRPPSYSRERLYYSYKSHCLAYTKSFISAPSHSNLWSNNFCQFFSTGCSPSGELCAWFGGAVSWFQWLHAIDSTQIDGFIPPVFEPWWEYCVNPATFFLTAVIPTIWYFFTWRVILQFLLVMFHFRGSIPLIIFWALEENNHVVCFVILPLIYILLCVCCLPSMRLVFLWLSFVLSSFVSNFKWFHTHFPVIKNQRVDSTLQNLSISHPRTSFDDNVLTLYLPIVQVSLVFSHMCTCIMMHYI